MARTGLSSNARRIVLVFLLLASTCFAQNPISAPPLATSRLGFPVQTLNAVPIPGASLSIVGTAGQTTYCYWAVANFQIGSVLSPLGCVSNAPNTLSVSNYVQIAPTSYPAGFTNGDFLRTTSNLAPTGTCNCAVSTGVTTGVVNDQSNSLSGYTVTLENVSSFQLFLTNEVTGVGATHLMLRNAAGTLISDLSTVGASGISGSGTTGKIPVFVTSTSLGNGTLTDNGTTANTVIVEVAQPSTCPSVGSTSLPLVMDCYGYRLDMNTGASVNAGNVAAAWIRSFAASVPVTRSIALEASALNNTTASATITDNRAVYAEALSTNIQAVTTNTAVYAIAQEGQGTITTNRAIYAISGELVSAAAVIANDYTTYLDSPSTAGSVNMTHHYGIFLADQSTGGANNPDPWGIFEAGSAKNQFGGIVNGIAGFQQNGTALAIGCGTTVSCANTATPLAHFVFGQAPLTSGTPSTAVVTGISPTFTSTTSYFCTVTNMTTQANPLKVTNTSTSSITITGPNTVTDLASYVCIGT